MSAKSRILAFDLMRGYFLLVILTDHLFRFPNLFEFVTGQGKLWVSAAEGFFLISGLLVGYLQQPLKKLWKRAFLLYLISILFTFIFTFWGRYLPNDKIKGGYQYPANLPQFIIRTVTFQYVYGWTDFLPYYAIFLLFAPLIITLARQTHFLIPLSLSFLAWLLFHHQNSYFAWQLLFMTGLLAGLYFEKIKIWLLNYKKHFTAITIITLLLSIYAVFYKNYPNNFLVDKDSVGLIRYFLSVIWFATLFSWVHPLENAFDKITLSIFSNLGKNSLLAYSLHGLVIFPLSSFIPAQTSFLANTLITAIAFLAVYGLAHSLKFIYNTSHVKSRISYQRNPHRATAKDFTIG